MTWQERQPDESAGERKQQLEVACVRGVTEGDFDAAVATRDLYPAPRWTLE